MSYYEQSLESKNENALRNLKHKNNISNDIEKLKNEITDALKNNIVIFNPSKNGTDIKNNLNDEKISTFVINKELNIKNKNRPFEKFNFNQL
jgi:superfamily II DNA/RNA helicase